MHRYTTAILCLNLCLLSNLFAQEVQVNVGYRFESVNSRPLLLSEDSVVFYEDNLNRIYTPFGIILNVPLTRKLDYQSGIQFNNASTGYLAFKKNENFLKQTTKGTVVGHPTLEFPQLATFSLYESGIWKLAILGGITPAIRVGMNSSKFDPINQPRWEKEVIDVLNAAPSTVKRAYVNYSYGLKAECGRFGLWALWQQNLSRNLAKPLEVWGDEHPFARRTGSLSFNLSFAFYRFKQKNGED